MISGEAVAAFVESDRTLQEEEKLRQSDDNILNYP